MLFLNLTLRRDSMRQKLLRIDYIGMALFIASVTALLLSLTWGGVIYPWNSWHTLVPLIIGAIALLATGFFEFRVPKEPMIPINLFNNRTSISAFFCSALCGLIIWCLIYYLPFYYQTCKGYTPIVAGLAMFPQTLTIAPLSLATGIMITVMGRYRGLLWVGWAICTLGLGLLCLLKPTTSIPGWIFLNIVPSIGIGILFSAMIFAIQASVRKEHLSIAVAMFVFFRSFGQSLGVALGGLIFQNRMYVNLLKYPELASHAVEYSRDVAALVTIVNHMPDGPAKTHLRIAYCDSLRIVWAFLCGVSGLALALSLLTKHYDLNQEHSSEQTLRKSDAGDLGEEKEQKPS